VGADLVSTITGGVPLSINASNSSAVILLISRKCKVTSCKVGLAPVVETVEVVEVFVVEVLVVVEVEVVEVFVVEVLVVVEVEVVEVFVVEVLVVVEVVDVLVGDVDVVEVVEVVVVDDDVDELFSPQLVTIGVTNISIITNREHRISSFLFISSPLLHSFLLFIFLLSNVLYYILFFV
jgi:hypothetical protein